MERMQRNSIIFAVALALVGIGVEVLLVVLQSTSYKLPGWALGVLAGVGGVLVLGGIVICVLAAAQKLPPRLAPFVWVGFRGQTVFDDASAMARYIGFRRDLKAALQKLWNMQTPTAPELRALADNLAQRFRDQGYDVTAKLLEVHLPDNATPGEVKERSETLKQELVRRLIWDEFA
jgi:hypothetical protein